MFNVVFLKKTDVVLTSYEWCIIVNVNLSTHDEVAPSINADLLCDRTAEERIYPCLRA
jgi:hypothetical protein